MIELKFLRSKERWNEKLKTES